MDRHMRPDRRGYVRKLREDTEPLDVIKEFKLLEAPYLIHNFKKWAREAQELLDNIVKPKPPGGSMMDDTPEPWEDDCC